MLKLVSLPRLHTLLIKKNPFLKDRLSLDRQHFLLSFEMDVSINQSVEKKIDEIVIQKIQIECFSNYLTKIQMYIELYRNNYFESGGNVQETTKFPKIKKIFELSHIKDIKIRRSYVANIKEDIFG